MIANLLLSGLILVVTSIFGTLVSGGVVFDSLFYASDLILFCLLVVILGVFIFISGYGKSFIKIFSSKNTFEKLEIKTLKEVEKSIIYACKVAAYEAIFFLCIGTVYYYVNWMNTQTLGFQLSLMILSVRYISTIEILLFCMKAVVRKQMISIMSEKESPVETSQKSSGAILLSLIKIIIYAGIIFGLTVFIIFNYTKNESDIFFGEIATWLDLPSFILIAIPSLLLLVSNGLWEDFFNGIKHAFSDRKNNISEIYKYESSVSTTRYIVLFLSLIIVMLGYNAVLTYLDNKESLGPNMLVDTIPCFYAIIINLILLSVEAKLNHLSE